MFWKSKFFRFSAVFSLIFVLFISGVEAKNLLPVPKNYVEDRAGVIDGASERQLNLLLKEVEEKTTIQFVILTVESTKGQGIEFFALEHAEGWQLGQKDRDNGILLVVAVKDRKYRFEIGYGLESVLPDSFCGSVGRQYLVPNFKTKNYSQGILAATAVLLNKVSAEYGVKFSGAPKITPRRQPARRRGNPIMGIIGFIFFIVTFMMMPPGMRRLLLLSMLLGGRRSYYGGRSSGFGGFGGFGGGGGGGFGGGGASGGW